MDLLAIPLIVTDDAELDSLGAALQLLQWSSFPHVGPFEVTLRELSENATLYN